MTTSRVFMVQWESATGLTPNGGAFAMLVDSLATEDEINEQAHDTLDDMGWPGIHHKITAITEYVPLRKG